MTNQTRAARPPKSPGNNRPRQLPNPVTSPRAYLEAKRGSEVAELLIKCAEESSALVLEQRRPALTSQERTQALRLATRLMPFLQRQVPVLARFLEPVRQYWWSPAKTKRGRRLKTPALFAQVMLRCGTGELLARGLRQLTATELMALASTQGIQVGQGDKRAMLDSWRKLLATHAPSDPEVIAEKFRKSLALQNEIQRLEALLKTSDKQTFSGARRLSDYLALGSSSNEEEDLNLGRALARRRYEPS